jgi:hypothetical protein
MGIDRTFPTAQIEPETVEVKIVRNNEVLKIFPTNDRIIPGVTRRFWMMDTRKPTAYSRE